MAFARARSFWEFSSGSESHVETDYSGPIARQHVHQCREFGPGPGPTPFCRQAFFVDHRQHDCWERSHLTTRAQTEVIGFQFEQVEDGGAGYVERDHDEDGAKCQGSRTDENKDCKRTLISYVSWSDGAPLGAPGQGPLGFYPAPASCRLPRKYLARRSPGAGQEDTIPRN